MLKTIRALTITMSVLGFFMMFGAVGHDDFMTVHSAGYEFKYTLAHMALGAFLMASGCLATWLVNKEIEDERR